ncbi:MAG: UbiA family prenyltransferase [Candidatus Thermoplasmatota archaeon]|nr:UbiA family prenyltransferase [Candidatus Thermoplasmatota archaeon]
MKLPFPQSCPLIRPFKFLSRWRSLPPYELLSYLFMYLSVPMLAFGIQPYTFDMYYVLLFTVITMYAGFFAALIWNDITDSDIDAKVHPDRPIPSGRISKKRFFEIALVFSALTFIGSILISVWCLLVVTGAALFVAVHDKYLKKRVRFPAYSEIFTPIQWIVVALFGYIAIWTVIPQSTQLTVTLPILGSIWTNSFELQNMLLLVLFIYFMDNAHDIPEGIHDIEGDRVQGVRTYATSFGERTAAYISFFWFVFSIVFGTLLFLRTSLTLLFFIPFVLLWVYTISFSIRLLKKDTVEMHTYGSVVGRKGFNFLLFSFDLMFLDLLLQLVFPAISFPL